MSNDTVNTILACDECEEMRKLVGIDWYPGLFSKLVFLATLMILTSTANIFLMYIASRTRSLVNNTKVFFNSLCIAHLMGSFIVIPFWIVTRLSPEMAKTTPGFCEASSFFWILMILASFYSLSALSLDRFFIISNPMRYPIKATTNKKLLVVTMLWIFCIMFAAAPIFGWGEYTFQPDAVPICGLDMKYSQSFTIVLIVLGFCAPLVVDIFCCGRIIAIARRQSRSIESRKGSDGSTSSTTSSRSTSSTKSIQPIPKLSKLKQKINSLRLVFAGTGSFLICWLPYLGAHVWMATIRNLSHNKESMPYILEFVVMCIALVNGLINPVVIMLSNRDYRKELKSLLFKRFAATSPEERSETESTPAHPKRTQFKSLNLTNTFQTIQEFHLDVSPHTPQETSCLRKQDSDATLDSPADRSPSTPSTEFLDIRKLSVMSNCTECIKLITRSKSNGSSIDLDSPLEQLKADGFPSQHATITKTSSSDQIETKIDFEFIASGIVIK
ncbi:histamine H2 receptor-like [Mercenaria mercenaria]|uniref:histamine H2 receptor-like n=1 Tax=Mercenaria mercenaria TaxID=6596 RepID=UPI00234E3C6E|nr:histamine H2 receptor-like [Mercenaria mercenaria]